jgi:hypothetical protein
MTPLEIFNQKWGLVENPSKEIIVEENFVLRNNKRVDIGIAINNIYVAYGIYQPKLEIPENKPSRIYFQKFAFENYQPEFHFSFYFDDKSLIINDLKMNYPYDELLINYNEFHERLKKRFNI